MKASIRRKLESKLTVLAHTAKTDLDKAAVHFAEKLLTDSDNDRFFGFLKPVGGNPFDEWRHVSRIVKTAHRPRHIPVLDRVRPVSPANFACGRFEYWPKNTQYKPLARPLNTGNIKRSTQQANAHIARLDASIAQRHERWEHEDSDNALRTEYFVSRDKYGRETRIAWSVLRLSQPEQFPVVAVDSRPRHADEVSPYWNEVLRQLSAMRVTTVDGHVRFVPGDIAIADRPTPATFKSATLHVRENRPYEVRQYGLVRLKWFAPAIYQPFGTSAIDRHNALAQRAMAEQPALNPRPIVQDKRLSDYTFERADGQTVHYRGLNPATEAMITFNPTAAEPENLQTLPDGVPMDRTFKTKYRAMQAIA